MTHREDPGSQCVLERVAVTKPHRSLVQKPSGENLELLPRSQTLDHLNPALGNVVSEITSIRVGEKRPALIPNFSVEIQLLVDDAATSRPAVRRYILRVVLVAFCRSFFNLPAAFADFTRSVRVTRIAEIEI
jgi:hypothetical protein